MKTESLELIVVDTQNAVAQHQADLRDMLPGYQWEEFAQRAQDAAEAAVIKERERVERQASTPRKGGVLMPNYHMDIVQGSDDWLAARLGIPTASEFDKILTPKELGLSKSSAKYMCRKLAEWIMGAPLEAFVSPWMERGKDLEAEAVRYYEMERDCETKLIGFVTTGAGMIGASPDRLVGADGLLELKCPSLETHVSYMLEPAAMVQEHSMQTQGQLWVCSDRTYCDLMSYSPGFPHVLARVYLREKVKNALALHVPAFVTTMLNCRERLLKEYGELRRERVTVEQRTAASHAAFDEYMSSGIG